MCCLLNVIRSIRGCLILSLFLLNAVLLASLAIIAVGVAWLMPVRSWHRSMMRVALGVPVLWMSLNKLIMLLSSFGKWTIQGSGELDTEKSYLLISNHSTWLDILVLGFVFNRKIPLLKFFMKKELVWTLPVAGLACWALGYPLMARHTKEEIRKNPELKNKDIESMKKACQKFRLSPTTVMNFVEGTRFTEAKQQRQKSPYQHLLKPKTAGIAFVLNEIHDQLSGIVNATIHYSEPGLSLWQFVKGDFRHITVHYNLLPIEKHLIGDYYQSRDFRKQFQAWLNGVWEQKDELLLNLKQRD